MQVPAFFATNLLTLDRIINAINNDGEAGNTVAEIAGYYAWNAATDNLDSENDLEQLSDNDFWAHLDALSDSGAKFDYSQALDVANQYKAAAVRDLHSSDA